MILLILIMENETGVTPSPILKYPHEFLLIWHHRKINLPRVIQFQTLQVKEMGNKEDAKNPILWMAYGMDA